MKETGYLHNLLLSLLLIILVNINGICYSEVIKGGRNYYDAGISDTLQCPTADASAGWNQQVQDAVKQANDVTDGLWSALSNNIPSGPHTAITAPLHISIPKYKIQKQNNAGVYDIYANDIYYDINHNYWVEENGIYPSTSSRCNGDIKSDKYYKYIVFSKTSANNYTNTTPEIFLSQILSNSGLNKNLGTPKSTCPTACDGNPINSGTGNKFQVETDFVGAPSTGLGLQRFYNSQDPTSTAFGVNWRSTWHRSIRQLTGTTINVVLADGRVDTFTKNVSGVWASDPDVTSTLNAVMSGITQTGWKLVTADDSTELYTLGGQLQSVTTRVGLITTIAYDVNSRLSTVTGPFGHQLAFAYDTSNRVSFVTLPDGGILSYGYDANNNLTSVKYPDSAVRQYVYNELANTTGISFPHALTGIVDENGNRFATYKYNSQERAVSSEHAGGAEKVSITYGSSTSSVTDALGNVHGYNFTTQFGMVKPTTVTGAPVQNVGAKSYTYGPNGFVASRTDFNGNLTTYTRDVRGLELSRTEAIGTPQSRTITTAWHSTFHLPLQITEPSGIAGVNRVTIFTYDSNGNLLKKTITAGGLTRTWLYTYSATSQPKSITDPNGNITMLAYDAKGGLASMTNALNQVTTYTNDADGRPVSITDPNSLVTKITYTPRGQVASQTVGQEVTSYARDLAGNLTKVILPDGSFLTYSYNSAHQLTRITDALGNYIAYTLDLVGNVTAEKTYDKTGNMRRTVSHAYDTVNRLAQNIGSLNQTTIYGRDANGNVTSITAPNSLKTVNSFDALNRLALSIDPNNGKTSIGYNPDDSVAVVTDPRGVTTRYTYDGLSNQVSVKSLDSGTTTRTFDAAGNILTSTDARGLTTTNSYDKLNRLTKQLFADGTYATYAYDQGTNGIGHLTTMTDPSGTTAWAFDQRGHVLQKKQKTGTVMLTTTNTYTPATGKLATAVLPSGQKLAYVYDPVSGLPSEIDVGSQPLIRSIQYQPFGLVAAWVQGSSATPHYGRSFDLDGYLSGISFANSAATGGVEAINLTRDLGGRITQIADNTMPTQLFTYDALNEIKGYAATGISQSYLYDPTGNRTQFTSTTIATSTANYTIDTASNRLLSRNVDGNVTNYTLDAAGNITGDGSSSFTIDASGHLAKVTVGSATTTYATNGLGERVKKSAASGATIFTQDANGNITGEYDGTTGAPLQETIYLGKLPVGVIKSGTIYYVNPDHLGAPRTITAMTGAPVWAWNRDPLGNGQPSVSGSFINNLRFPGQYYDAETGLFHNNARDYDPTTGRYIQSDPIGLRGGVNPYIYVGGNPVNLSDLTGTTVALDPMVTNALMITANWMKDYGESHGLTKILIVDGFDPKVAAGITGLLEGIGAGTTLAAPAYSLGPWVGVPANIILSTELGYLNYLVEYANEANKEENKTSVTSKGFCQIH